MNQNEGRNRPFALYCWLVMINHHQTLKQLYFNLIGEKELSSCCFSCMSKFTVCKSQEQVWHDQTSLAVNSDEGELMKPARTRIPDVFNSSSLRWSQYAFISHLYESTFKLYVPVFWFSVNAHLQTQTKITDDTIKFIFSQTHWRSLCHRRHDTTKQHSENVTFAFMSTLAPVRTKKILN